MSGKIFVNYRRDDERAFAARVRDRLVQTFGEANVFMDVDNLMAGQRFDRELEKALAKTDVLLAVMGPRWMNIYEERRASGERDYVHEEIAAALRRGITLIPVLIEGAKLPRADALPEDIRPLVLHQKHDVSHEQFGQNMAALVEAIRFARRAALGASGAKVAWRWISSGLIATLVLGYIGAYHLGMPVPWPAIAGFAPASPMVKQPEPMTQASVSRSPETRRKPEDDRKPTEDEALLVDGLAPGSGKSARDCWVADGQKICGPEMIALPAGEFRMGAPDDSDAEPIRDVKITNAFAVGRTHVTRGEYAAFVQDTGRKTDLGCYGFTKNTKWELKPEASWHEPGFAQDDRHPVVCVHWGDATAYAKWLSEKSGKDYRLLTEAEAEYAIRGVTSTNVLHPRNWFGSDEVDFCSYANSADQSLKAHISNLKDWTFASCNDNFAYTSPSASFRPNPFGLFDPVGNVWSWTQDCWNKNHESAPLDERARTTGDCNLRVTRGGAFMLGPRLLHSGLRYRYIAGIRYDVVGFRIARALKSKRP